MTAKKKAVKAALEQADMGKYIDDIRIMGVNCIVEFNKNLDYGENLGTYELSTGRIRICDAPHISNVMKARTLLHEIIEAILANTEVDVDHSVITTLETGLFQVLMDNPHLVSMFLWVQDEGMIPEGEK